LELSEAARELGKKLERDLLVPGFKGSGKAVFTDWDWDKPYPKAKKG